MPGIPSTSTPTPSPSINVHLGPTLLPRPALALPAPSAGTLSVSTPITTASTSATSSAQALSASTRLLFVSTPTDKTLLQSEGSTIWALRSGEVGEEVDELVKEGHAADALGLVEAVGEGGLSPVRSLHCAFGEKEPLTVFAVPPPTTSQNAECGLSIRQRPLSTCNGHISRLQRQSGTCHIPVPRRHHIWTATCRA